MPVHVRPPAALTRRPATGGACRASPAPGIAALQRKADASPATRRLAALKARLPEATGPVIQAKFAGKTTFGLEIEFKNRWISSYDLGKSVPRMGLSGLLDGWGAESDAGRLFPKDAEMVRGTVLEVETRPYSSAEMKDGTVSDDIKVMYDTSADIAEMSAARGVVSDLEAAKGGPARDSALEEELDRLMAADHDAAPEATLQITTLGKRTPEHLAALSATADSFEDKNIELLRGEDGEPPGWATSLALARKSAKAELVAFELIADLDKGPAAAKKRKALIFEDFAATLSPMVQIISLGEQGLMAGWGTIKNLIAPVLPRRVIRPPKEGFANALGMDQPTYKALLFQYRERILKLEPAGLDADAIFLFSLLAQGLGLESRRMDSVGNKLRDYMAELKAGAKSRDQGKPVEDRHGLSLLHTVAGSEPTLEDKIIAKAVETKQIDEDRKGEWTSHEIRNALFAQGMSAEDMQAFIALVGKQT